MRERLREARVFAAFFAAAERAPLVRRDALERAWRESARGEAALCPSRLSAFSVARDRFEDGFLFGFCRPFAVSFAALRLVDSEVVEALGAPSFTPARRALDKPIAMACFVFRAPCLPSRT